MMGAYLSAARPRCQFQESRNVLDLHMAYGAMKTPEAFIVATHLLGKGDYWP